MLHTLTSLLPLNPSETDVWLTHVGEALSPAQAAAYDALMTDEERARGQRFHFERDRARHAVTRALVRTVLSRYAPGEPHAWRFRLNAHGRPELDVDEGPAASLRFNVSHTFGLVACAVTRGAEVGVDVEDETRRGHARLDIAERHFAPSEFAELEALPEADRNARFFEQWTLKEAYIKARGMGLALPLKRFGYALRDAGRIELSIDASLNDRADRWALWQYRPTERHVLSLCREHGGQRLSTPVLRDVVPLGEERLLDAVALRRSAHTA